MNQSATQSATQMASQDIIARSKFTEGQKDGIVGTAFAMIKIIDGTDKGKGSLSNSSASQWQSRSHRGRPGSSLASRLPGTGKRIKRFRMF